MNTPYGETLVDLLVDDARAAEMKATSKDYASLTLDERSLCDLELLAVGGFSPLRGFLGKADYERVVGEMRLADGALWPIPVTLPVAPGEGVDEGKPLALRDVYGNLLAFLHVEEIYAYDKAAEAQGVYGATDAGHPSVAYLNRQPGHYAAGRLEVLRPPPHFDFVELRRTPAELREHFKALGWNKIVAFQTRDPIHRAVEEVHEARRGADRRRVADPPRRRRDQAGRRRSLHSGRCYRALVDDDREPGSVVLSLLPLALRTAGPREVILHAIIRRNYGCTHFIVGRDHAGPGNDGVGKPLYAPDASQESDGQATRPRLGWRWSSSNRWSTSPNSRVTRRSTRFPKGSRRPPSRTPRSATTTWPRACRCPTGSAGPPSPRSSTRPILPGSARA